MDQAVLAGRRQSARRRDPLARQARSAPPGRRPDARGARPPAPRVRAATRSRDRRGASTPATSSPHRRATPPARAAAPRWRARRSGDARPFGVPASRASDPERAVTRTFEHGRPLITQMAVRSCQREEVPLPRLRELMSSWDRGRLSTPGELALASRVSGSAVAQRRGDPAAHAGPAGLDDRCALGRRSRPPRSP